MCGLCLAFFWTLICTGHITHIMDIVIGILNLNINYIYVRRCGSIKLWSAKNIWIANFSLKLIPNLLVGFFFFCCSLFKSLFDLMWSTSTSTVIRHLQIVRSFRGFFLFCISTIVLEWNILPAADIYYTHELFQVFYLRKTTQTHSYAASQSDQSGQQQKKQKVVNAK